MIVRGQLPDGSYVAIPRANIKRVIYEGERQSSPAITKAGLESRILPSQLRVELLSGGEEVFVGQAADQIWDRIEGRVGFFSGRG